MTFPPERIVCLTEETVETLYLLGQERKIVGVSGYAVRPKRVRKEKPRVSAFISANVPKILKLNPDLVLTFSDIQAEISAKLISEGLEVHCFNHRTIKGIFEMIISLGSMVGAPEESQKLVNDLKRRLALVKKIVDGRPPLKVYFEEWDDPLISGINWVSELVEIAGGTDIFGDKSKQKSARDRVVTSKEVIDANPDIIIASWCGKKVQPKRIIGRKGWSNISAIAENQVFEIKSSIILQPGPAALTDGLDAILNIFKQHKSWKGENIS